MISNLQDGYVLVKDKDGELKYYKEGKFFSIAEIEKQRQIALQKNTSPKEKVELKPAYSFDTVKRSVQVKQPDQVKQSVQVRQLPEDIRKELRKIGPEIEIPKSHKKPIFPSKLKPLDLEPEELKPHSDFHERRNQDQELVQKKVDEVIERLKIKFSDSSIEKRFRNILLTYFRGIRKDKELVYVLGLPKISGGMELDDTKIKIILSVINQHVEELEKDRRHLASKPLADDIQAVADMEHRLAPPPPAIIQDNSKNNQVEKNRFQARTMPKPAIQRPTPVSLSAKRPDRPTITDIKRRRLIGPVEELEMMNIENLRRLGENEHEIMEEVLEKIQILAEQSLLKKIEGINAWKSSAIYKLYLQMTYEAIVNKRSIADIIEQRQLKNQETLTLSEYEMLGNINSKLNLA